MTNALCHMFLSLIECFYSVACSSEFEEKTLKSNSTIKHHDIRMNACEWMILIMLEETLRKGLL